MYSVHLGLIEKRVVLIEHKSSPSTFKKCGRATQKNFVADFLQAKCDFRRKSAVLRFWAPFGGLRSNVRWSS